MKKLEYDYVFRTGKDLIKQIELDLGYDDRIIPIETNETNTLVIGEYVVSIYETEDKIYVEYKTI